MTLDLSILLPELKLKKINNYDYKSEEMDLYITTKDQSPGTVRYNMRNNYKSENGYISIDWLMEKRGMKYFLEQYNNLGIE